MGELGEVSLFVKNETFLRGFQTLFMQSNDSKTKKKYTVGHV